jgi:hypothetical protein
MKKITIAFALLFTVAGIQAQTIRVRSEAAENMNFAKYKTFTWASQVSSELDPGLYFLNDLSMKSQVREAVKAELMGRGYREIPGDADLVVNFRVFDKATKIKSMEDYGSDYWGETQFTGISETIPSVDIEAGTLLLSLADRAQGKVIWQGFASGLIDNNQFVKDEVKVREAVKLIFENFNHTVTDYSRK